MEAPINEKSVWMDGARHGTEIGLDLAIKLLTEFRDAARKDLNLKTKDNKEKK